jgi:hypothetical protein
VGADVAGEVLWGVVEVVEVGARPRNDRRSLTSVGSSRWKTSLALVLRGDSSW